MIVLRRFGGSYTAGMGNIVTVGTYLKTLREGRGLSRFEIAKEVNTNEVQILRIENGDIDTRGSLLLAFLRIVEGSADQLTALMTTPGAIPEHGQQLAVEWLKRDHIGNEIVSSTTDESLEPYILPNRLHTLTTDEIIDIIIRLGIELQTRQNKTDSS